MLAVCCCIGIGNICSKVCSQWRIALNFPVDCNCLISLLKLYDGCDSDIDILKAVGQLGSVKSICRWRYYRLWLFGLAIESSLQQLWKWNPVIGVSWSASVTASLLSPHFVSFIFCPINPTGRAEVQIYSFVCVFVHACECWFKEAKLAIPCAVVLQVCTLKTLCFMQNCCMQWMCMITISGNGPTTVLQSVWQQSHVHKLSVFLK